MYKYMCTKVSIPSKLRYSAEVSIIIMLIIAVNMGRDGIYSIFIFAIFARMWLSASL